MSIDIHTIFTAHDLRGAVAKARHLIKVCDKDDKLFEWDLEKIQEYAEELKNERVADKLEYLFRFITMLSWLPKKVDKFDPDPR